MYNFPYPKEDLRLRAIKDTYAGNVETWRGQQKLHSKRREISVPENQAKGLGYDSRKVGLTELLWQFC